MVVVITSNWHPDDLYKDGLQRENFLPFIGMIKEKLDIIHLDSPHDYRLQDPIISQVYFSPLNQAASRALQFHFDRFKDGAAIKTVKLDLPGRQLTFEKAAGSVVAFQFQAFFGKPLGSEDFLVMAKNFTMFILDNVKVIDPAQINIAKRFITFIDVLYENQCKLIMAAEAPPQDLYPRGKHAFEFQRTVSRLREMQTKAYLEKPTLPKNPSKNPPKNPI